MPSTEPARHTGNSKHAPHGGHGPAHGGGAHHGGTHKGSPAAATAQADTPRALEHREIRTIMIGIMLAMFLGALDQTIVATALPTIGRTFGNLNDLSWVVTAYLLTGTAVTPLYGKLSDLHGRRSVMLTAIAIFIVGSIACAMANSMMALVLARALQGLGGGGLIALAQTIIADAVSPRERGRYQGYISAVFALSSIGGPVLGGLLTEHLSWAYIFWINVPLGLAALGMTSHALRLIPFRPRRHRLDIIGALLMMAASVALLLPLSWGGARYPWLSLEIGALLATSAVLWALFAWRLLAIAEPFLPLSVLGNPVVRSAALAGSCCMGTLVGMTIFVPLYFEVVLHLSAGQSGLALIPLMFATVLWSTVTGRLMMHMQHYKRVPLIGLTLAIISLLVLAVWPASLPTWVVLTVLFVLGSGLGSLFPISTVCLQNAVPHAQMGIATGAANFFRALFSALVVAVLGAIVLGGLGGEAGASMETLMRAASSHDLATAFRFVFLAGALVVSFAMAFTIALEERPLRGPTNPNAGEPTAPATPIPDLH
jgi:EmrB/QacA subfamily drug resistance transporter